MPANRPTSKVRPTIANRPKPKPSPRIGNIIPAPQPSTASKLVKAPVRAVNKMNSLVGDWGARHGMGGPNGRISAWQEGYERSLAFTQPGARGLLSALSGSFGGDIDEDTRQLVTLRQALQGSGSDVAQRMK